MKIRIVEESPAVDERSRCETMTSRDNELLLIEKFISDRAAQRGRGDGKSRAFLTTYSHPFCLPHPPETVLPWSGAGERSAVMSDPGTPQPAPSPMMT